MNARHPMALDLNTLRSQLRYLPQALGLVWSASRHWTVVWAVLLVLQGALPVATVYLTRMVVDSLVAATTNAGGGQHCNPPCSSSQLWSGCCC